ncbi:TIGR04282 family arsenosugar biosynthesis glycosyltransferase [Solicola gregarius]|uniref:DUF2064 domain-containing protein n=1 Tax=Solicola gregarius TaxID=2908642 RepID=A0AA46TFU0_9ACTN|nr:DUF2064 domain-containing protein [Solicola gregarius]UYM04554.1 DUF2064 domain-containing protein [Solicola gregarius]
MNEPTVLIVARAPVPGRAKTRLAAYVGDETAARLAGAALLDTIDAADRTGWPVCVAMTGSLADSVMSAEIEEALSPHRRIGQRGGGFAARLAAAHSDADRGGGVVQIGMDTPHVRPEVLRAAGRALTRHDAVLGPAHDGGWWVLAVRDASHAECLRDVPMSTEHTGELTRQALRARGARVADAPALTDVDTWADALEVGAIAPDTRFGRAVAGLRDGDVG